MTILLHVVLIGQTSTTGNWKMFSLWPNGVLRLKQNNLMFQANVLCILKTKAIIQQSCFCHPLNLGILKAFNLLNYTGNYIHHCFNMKKELQYAHTLHA